MGSFRTRVVWIMILAVVILAFAAETRIDAFPFTTVFIKKPRRFYHRMNCVAVKSGRPTAISLANAKEQGYRPCPKCQPPTW